MKYKKFLEIINGSKSFKFEDGEHGSTILVLTNYYSGETIKLDLALLSEKSINKILIVDGDK